MSNFKIEIVSAEGIAKEFRLSDQVAREIVAEETRIALLGKWQPWALIIFGLSMAGFIYFSNAGSSTSAVFITVFTVLIWTFLGRYLARSKIREMALAKSDRIHGSHT